MADITGSVSRNSGRFTYYLRCTEQDVSGGADNRSKVRVGIRIRSGGSSTWAVRSASATHTITINGVNYTATSGAYSLIGGQDIEIASVTSGWIPHNTDGSKTVSISASSPDLAQGNGYGPYSGSASGSMALTKIPRYPTANHSLNSKTLNSIKMNWSSDSTIDYLWYSTNGGSNWTGVDVADGTSGTYTISNLSPNTAYNIKTRLRRKDSQLSTDTGNLSVTTYNKATISSAPNINHGDSETVTYSNPGNATMNIGIYDLAGMVAYLGYRACTGSSYTFQFTDDVLDTLYRLYGANNSITVRVYLRTTCNNVHYYDSRDITITLKGNQKTAHIGIGNKRAKVFVGAGGVKRAVEWVGNNGRKRCI